MKIIIILIVSIILGSLLYFTFKNRLNQKNSIILLVLFALLVFVISIYTHLSTKQNQQYTNIIASFERGEEITCEDIKVSDKEFTFTNGTLSFTGKKGTKFYNQIISINDCK